MQKFSMKDLPCEKVIVYEDRAEIKRSIKTKLNQGEHKLVITNVSNSVETDSIKIEGTGEALVIDVVCQVRKVIDADVHHGENDEFDKLKSEIKDLEKMEDLTNFKLDRLTMQKGLLNDFAGHLAKPSGMHSIEPLYGDEKNDTIDSKNEIETFMTFMTTYNERVEELDNLKYDVIKELMKIREKLDVARNSLLKLNASRTVMNLNDAIEVSILIESKYDNSEIELHVSYLVSNATWTPKYDMRVLSEDKSIKLNYCGVITQCTGEDWKDAKIFLSTAIPSIGTNLPDLETQNVRFRQKENDSEKKPLTERKSKSFDDVHLMLISVPLIQQETSLVKKLGFTTTFEIPRNATIPSDSSPHKVSIGIIDLKADFEYVSIPKKNPAVYIKARVVNQSNYLLLAGQANVFLDNAFVAQTELKTCSPQEEFFCLLGIDSTIKIEYKPIKKTIGQTGLLSRFTNVTYVQVIEVKNTTSNTVKIMIHDNLPLSNDDKIQVKLLEPVLKNNPNVHLNKKNNLEFDLTVPPLKTEEILIKYNIEYHADQEIDFF